MQATSLIGIRMLSKPMARESDDVNSTTAADEPHRNRKPTLSCLSQFMNWVTPEKRAIPVRYRPATAGALADINSECSARHSKGLAAIQTGQAVARPC